MRGRSAGFTLLEVLLVMALIAAVGLLAMATVGGGMQRMQIRSAANEVAAQLRFTRAQAIATGQPQQFILNPVQRTWRAPRERSGVLPESMRVEMTAARELQPAQGEGAIVFFEDGASSGGRVRLEVSGAVWQIDVAWLTGQVRTKRLGVADVAGVHLPPSPFGDFLRERGKGNPSSLYEVANRLRPMAAEVPPSFVSIDQPHLLPPSAGEVPEGRWGQAFPLAAATP